MKFILTIVIAFLLFNYLQTNYRPDYTGYFYSDITNYDNRIKLADLSSYEKCKEWVGKMIAKDSDGVYDYQCGKNCHTTETQNYDQCQEIRK